ncbi:PREDICTED: uncharacterized protein LOC106813470 [Priapulus caudatus]|uniref:Uncharacterized protein LOC106813470 n=1 Tax=Priapulus caudatus TaxID=37621 RepID=A0ABM1ELM2_PRICU|nr:PREDICTED: uncharacterized protein LOC106813470 [Priapulus caudatus]
MRGRRLRVIYCVVALLFCVAYLLQYLSIVGVAPRGDRTHLTGYRDGRATHAKPSNRTVDASPPRTRQAAVPRFTVVMMTYRRNDLLRMVLTNYSKMAFIYRIILLWHNLGEEVPDFPYDIAKGAGKELIVIRPERNLLSIQPIRSFQARNANSFLHCLCCIYGPVVSNERNHSYLKFLLHYPVLMDAPHLDALSSIRATHLCHDRAKMRTLVEIHFHHLTKGYQVGGTSA